VPKKPMILTAIDLAPFDHGLADATIKRMRDVLALLRRKDVTRLVGRQRARSARWALVAA